MHTNFRPLAGSKPDRALVINIFGGPGSGKSTIAGQIFTDLKQKGVEVANPEEQAKLAIWSNQAWLLDHQTILLGRTWETILARQDKVDVIVMDSPALLCSVYAGNREPSCFHALVADIHKRTDRINLFLMRDGLRTYSMNGRRETEQEARILDERIITTLDTHSEHYLKIERGTTHLQAITASILDHVHEMRMSA